MRRGGLRTSGDRRRPAIAGARTAIALRRAAVGLAVASAAGAVGLASPAGAAERLVVSGAGFGHGVGLSQWGARGMAAKGADARTILAHYYTGTGLSKLPDGRHVRVELQSGRPEATVAGAASIGGLRTDPARSYRLLRSGSGIEIRRLGARRALGRSTTGVQVLAGAAGTVQVAGRAADGVQDGTFRGRVDVLPDGGDDVLVVNDLDLEDYLRGVVTEESPADWPAAALQAQAIAARTYAITAPVAGQPFDQWPDTRSQVYTGVSGETAAGDRAVAATRGLLVTIDRRPVTTYFFSTSGGRTEDARNVFPDPQERSWLRSVPDPDEGDAAPLHRWTRTFSTGSAASRTARFGVGALRRIEVLRRGDSPRIVRARVVGSTGSTEVSGEALQRAFDLPDRWATFASVSISRCLRTARVGGPGVAGDETGSTGTMGAAPTPGHAPPGTAPVVADDPATGALAIAERGSHDLAALLDRAGQRTPARRDGRPSGCRFVGGVRPAPSGTPAQLQRRDGAAWTTVRTVALDGAGGFSVIVPRSGAEWRVRAGAFATPSARG